MARSRIRRRRGKRQEETRVRRGRSVEAETRRRTRAAASDVTVQPKLRIGSTDDAAERQADANAARIMSGRKARPATAATSGSLQRKETYASASASAVSSDVASKVDGLNGRGRALDPADRSFFAPRMPEVDLDAVRLHTDPESRGLARSLKARAFTHRHNIVIGPGEDRTTPNRRALLAHELTHVAQQRRASDEGVIRRQPIETVPGSPTMVPPAGPGRIPGSAAAWKQFFHLGHTLLAGFLYRRAVMRKIEQWRPEIEAFAQSHPDEGVLIVVGLQQQRQAGGTALGIQYIQRQFGGFTKKEAIERWRRDDHLFPGPTPGYVSGEVRYIWGNLDKGTWDV